ncbi:hypothetical protein GGH92_009307, partial [Coemansia sp. RSA 2673]
PTLEEQQAIDLINDQHRSSLLAGLPQEPSDFRPKLDANAWLTSERILIYLRSSKGDSGRAVKRLRSTLEWRATYRPHAITPADMLEEGATGKQYVNGFDRGGRPIIYMFPHKENTKNPAENLRWVVFNMEQAIRSMPPGATKTTIIVDTSKYSLSQAVPLSTAREFLNILESHYPERLHKAFILSPPSYFVLFYHIVSPFIDPVTKAKIAFVDLAAGAKAKPTAAGPWANIFDHIEAEQLQSDVGGAWEYRYSQEAYWPVLERMHNALAVSPRMPE